MKIQKYYLLVALLLGISFGVNAKAEVEPTITPAFFKYNEEITIRYDLKGTELENLSDAYMWLWAKDPDGLAGFKYDVSPATADQANAKFTKVETGVFEIKFVPKDMFKTDISSLKKMGILLKGKDWGDGQTVDYIADVSAAGLALKLNAPSEQNFFVVENSNIEVKAVASAAAIFTLSVNGEVKDTQQNITDYSYSLVVGSTPAQGEVMLKVFNSTDTVTSTFTYNISPTSEVANLPEGVKAGINYHDGDETKVTLVLEAPKKEFVYVIGDFNDWKVSADYLMKKTADGEFFWIELSGLTPKEEYIFQYLVDGVIRVADPYTEKVSDPYDDHRISNDTYPNLKQYPTGKTTNRAGFLQTGQTTYTWKVTDFKIPAVSEVVAYELLVRDFDEKHTFKAVVERMEYLKSLGINTIQLMPFNEFEGNESWGYNPNFYFAVDKYYGTKDDLKALIDVAHENGMAVVMDMVLNHSFNSSPMARMYWNNTANKPAADNPWFNEDTNFENPILNWGSDFDHESKYTKAFVDRVNKFWLEEFNLDGFRFDFTKGFTNDYKAESDDYWGSNYDQSRIDLLKRMVDEIRKVKPDAIIQMEHLAENKEEKVLADYGIMLWGNMNHNFRDIIKGDKSSDLGGLYYGTRGWSKNVLLAYMESHDEERLMYDALENGELSPTLEYDASSLPTAVERNQMLTALYMMVPGPKMIWMFGEQGYDYSIDYNGRVGNKPIKWEYLEDANRKKLFDTYAYFLSLKKELGLSENYTFTSSMSGTVKKIYLTAKAGTDLPNLVVVANTAMLEKTSTVKFSATGTWYDLVTLEEKNVTAAEEEMTLRLGEFRVFASKKPTTLPKAALATFPALKVRETPIDTKAKVIVSPNLFQVTDEITVTFDLSNTTQAGKFSDAWAWVWATAPKDIGSPKYNNSPATSNEAPVKFTEVRDDVFEVKFVPQDIFGESVASMTEMGILLKGRDWGDGQTADFTLKVGSPNETPNGIGGTPKVENLTVYPNPVTNILHVNNVPMDGHLEVFDLSGIRQKVSFQETTKGSVSADLSALEAGVYIVRQLSAGSVKVTRIVKK